MEIGRGPEYLARYPTTLLRGSFVPITELSKMIENGRSFCLCSCLALLTVVVDWFEVIDNLEEDLFDGDDWLSELLREGPKDGVNVDVEPVESSAPVAEELTLDPSLLTLPTYTNYPRSYTQTFEPRDLPMNHVFPLTLQQSVSTEDEIRFTPSTNSILTPSGSSAHSQSPPRAAKTQKRKPKPDHKADRSDVLTTDLVRCLNQCCSH